MASTPQNLAKTAAIEHERLNSLINSMADGVIAVDRHAKVLLYNGAALNILDVNNSMTGTQLGKHLKVIDKNNQPLDIDDLIKHTTLPTTSRDLKLIYQDGSNANLYLSIAPVRLGYGKQSNDSYVLLLRDITKEKSLEEERDEFISVVSHELRTPIAIAEGNISNAQFISTKSQDITQVTKALEDAHKQIMFLSDMINDLSTLSRAERGVLVPEIEPINVRELVMELGANYQEEAHAKGLKIVTRPSPELEVLTSSKLYVREILQNFVTNALKYTRKGHLTIAAKPAKKGVEFIVSDTGIGISKTDQERVFDKFFRSEDYRTRETSGTGLGLYITMKLARLIHAEITLKSELNHGSAFSIYIPNLR